MAKVVHDDLWFCDDCLFANVNGDFSGLDYHYGNGADARQAKIVAGMDYLSRAGHIVPDFDSETNEGIHEFSRVRCDCCRTPLAGLRHRFAILS